MAILYVLWQARSYRGVVEYLQMALPFKLEDAEAREGLTLNAFEPKIKSKDDEKYCAYEIMQGCETPSTVHERI